MKYKDWLKIWLEDYIKPSVKIRTYELYRFVIDKKILPYLGNYEMNDLTSILLQKYVGSMLKIGDENHTKGLSSNTVNGIISIIQNSLETAFEGGEIDKYIGNKIKRPKLKEKTVSCFTFEEQKKIEKEVFNRKNDNAIGIIICLYTGLRIGELMALTWNDIDFKNAIISVNKSCHDGKNESGKYTKIIETPKTDSSTRVIPIPKQLIPILRECHKRSCSYYVISNRGKAILVRSYQYLFESLLKKLKIKHRGFHSLRHTFATRALECGMDIKTLSEILGHKSPTVTLNRYAHSMPNHKREMMNKLGKLVVINGLNML